MNVKTTLAAIAVVALASPLANLAPASAKAGDVIKTGSCTGSTDWKVKAKPDNGRYEVEGEVDSNRVGQTWNWKIKHNGTVEASGTATTTGPSGSFSVQRRLANRAGLDTFTFRAIDPKSGEVCKGSVTI